ncbi:MAG: ABC transporter permease [Kiloniellales bacterium]|jgi:spermidine/putrescine transport system permease protein|nr:ABC transporter permease [Kiloniellales bacterium]
MTGRRRRLARLGRLYMAAVLLFLYVPIAVMAVMSFNASRLYRLPVDWSVTWYVALAGNDKLINAGLNSVWVALVTTAIATALGTAASLAFFRYEFRAKRLLQLLLFPPIAIPWLIIGTAMLVFFFWIGIGRGLHAMVLGHVALALPYVIIVVSARLRSFDPHLEEAARSLGASPWQATRRVTLPWIAPGMVAAALFAFAVSFDQFVISYFLSAPGVTTLPVEIYTAIRKGFTPEINAVSTIVIAVSMALLLGVARFYRFGGER